MRVRGALAIMAVAAALCTASPAGAQPAGSEPYGLIAASGNLVPGSTSPERTANYRRLYEAGVRAIRIDFLWSAVEPPGSPPRDFDFTALDTEVKAITDAGLRLIGILAYGHPDHSAFGAAADAAPTADGLPPFGLGSSRSFPPDDPADFAAYVRATAEHYGDEVIAWEVWNEQNQGYRFWPPREDPAAYARLLCAAHAAVEAVDPATPVLFGGLFFPAVAELPGMSAPTFLEASYRENRRLGGCFDALAYHPYPYPFTAPEVDVPIRGSVLSAAAQMRAVLARHGDADKPLWITEIGWPTHAAYGVSEAKQAEYLPRMLAASFAQGLPVVSWYTYGDGADPTGGANQEAHFGLFRDDNSPKPAYLALATFGEVMHGTRYAAERSRELGLVPPGGDQRATYEGLHAFEYRRGEKRVTALWLATESLYSHQGPFSGSSGASVEVLVPVRAPRVTVVGHLGERRALSAASGVIALRVGSAPQYVVDDAGAPRPPRLFLRHRRGRSATGRRCARLPVRARVSGGGIESVRFSVDRRVAATDRRAPFETLLRRSLARAGVHEIRAVIDRAERDRVSIVRRLRSCGPGPPRGQAG